MKNKDKLKKMTLEEKASFLSGKTAWHTTDNKDFEIKSIRMADGPHGLRIGENENTTIFPNNCAVACSFNVEISKIMGEQIGIECVENDVDVLLGPGINIKRLATGGRNFEYYSEDPLLSGKLGAAFVEGVQSNGIAACVKHYCANNQEYNRFTYDAIIDEQTLREVYLKPFEIVVKESKPKMLMTAYNKINGEYASDNSLTLRKILRKEWKYKGVVISDWGAVDNRVKSLKNSLDIEMPSTAGVTNNDVVKAVKDKKLSEKYVDESTERIIDLSENLHMSKPKLIKIPSVSRILAEQCIVLLKNENNILPLNINSKAAVFGELAEKPRFQGCGSSKINNSNVSNPLDKITQTDNNITFCRGYLSNEDIGKENEFKKAAIAAENAEYCIVFLGTDEKNEAEGYDRKDIILPKNQIEFVKKLASINKNIIVVLMNGGVVECESWKAYAKGIIEANLLGQGVGDAIADIIFGKVNPSGRLAETFPKQLSDTPGYLNYPGINNIVKYSENLFVGYKYYTSKKIEVSFPFGYGLSYSNFEYFDFYSDSNKINDDKDIKLSVKIKNISKIDGYEVVQFYINQKFLKTIPVTALVGFKKIFIKAGETALVEYTFNSKNLKHFNVTNKKYEYVTGNYEISVNKDCNTAIFTLPLEIKHKQSRDKFVCHRNTTIGELLCYKNKIGLVKEYLKGLMGVALRSNPDIEIDFNNIEKSLSYTEICMLKTYPLRAFIPLTNGFINTERLEFIISEFNK